MFGGGAIWSGQGKLEFQFNERCMPNISPVIMTYSFDAFDNITYGQHETCFGNLDWHQDGMYALLA